MKVAEIFASIQGEGRYIGKPTAFVRFAGCNMDCRWCDTKYARTGGREMSVAEVVKGVRKLGLKNVCITGGEPMTQLTSLRQLVKKLKTAGYEVVLETNGSKYDREVFARVDCVSADMKPPSSGEKSDEQILSKLTDKDQVKIVVADEKDMEFAKRIITETKTEVIIQPMDGKDLKRIAQEALKLKLDVRVLPQLHKVAGLR